MSSTGHANRRGANRWHRVLLYVLIGAVMAGAALAGYAFLGPRADAAAGSHQRPAAIATNAPLPTATSATGAAPAVSETPVPPPIGSELSASDLAIMYAEMADIKRQMDTLMDQTPIDSGTPTKVGTPDDGGASDIPAATLDTALSTLNDMMSALHGMMAIMDEAARSMGNR